MIETSAVRLNKCLTIESKQIKKPCTYKRNLKWRIFPTQQFCECRESFLHADKNVFHLEGKREISGYFRKFIIVIFTSFFVSLFPSQSKAQEKFIFAWKMFLKSIWKISSAQTKGIFWEFSMPQGRSKGRFSDKLESTLDRPHISEKIKPHSYVCLLVQMSVDDIQGGSQ